MVDGADFRRAVGFFERDEVDAVGVFEFVPVAVIDAGLVPDEHHFAAEQREAPAHVDRRRRLADPALLVDERYDPHASPWVCSWEPAMCIPIPIDAILPLLRMRLHKVFTSKFRAPGQMRPDGRGFPLGII